MRQKASLILTLAAWLLATGSHWDLVQTFAWAKMFAGYARTLPLGEALERTFDAERPCELCQAVAEGKRDQNAPGTASKALKKVELALGAEGVRAVAPKTTTRFVVRPETWMDRVKAEPSVPPPRGRLA